MKNKDQNGFTLIELLVVVAIIAILAAILFPVFAKVREKARQTSCLSNLKQLGLGIAQYEQDYDEHCPNGLNPYGGGNGWAGQIYTYIKSVGVYKCPDDNTTGNISSYAYNANVVTPAPAPPAGSPTSASIAQYNSPTRTILLAEVTNSEFYDVSTEMPALLASFGGSPGGYGLGGSFDPGGFNSNGGTAGGTASTLKWATGYLRGSRTGAAQGDFTGPNGRHTDGANYLMADTHAKWFRPAAVSAGFNNLTAANCGSGTTAAATDCTDGTIGATFSIN